MDQSNNTQRILVCGHRNPDTDSVCSAFAYAELKNRLCDEDTYLAIRCGNVNEQTSFVFESAALPLPPLVSDIRTRAVAVARSDIPPLDADTSIFAALRILEAETLSILPLLTAEGIFEGLLSINEIARFFMQEDIEQRPVYRFLTKNFEQTVPGFFLKQGPYDFTASIMIGAMPFETSIERINAIKSGLPLLITGLRPDILQYAIEKNFPAIVLTGCENGCANGIFDGYEGTVYISRIDTAESVRRLRLSTPVSSIVNRKPLTIAADTLFDQARDTLVNSHYRGLPVMDNGAYRGIVTRRCFISKPRPRLIMVDHNESAQSVMGADNADVVEIIDHHRLGAAATMLPILIDVRPVGSTCTIVYLHYKEKNITIGSQIALLLLSGILADTVRLHSPTTTEHDRRAADDLAALAGTGVEQWGARLFEHTSSLRVDNYDELVGSDFKIYHECGVEIGIGQIEVSSFQEYPAAEEAIVKALEKVKLEKSLDWALLLVTNVIKEESILVTSESPLYQRELSYEALNPQCYRLKGVLSRKKQLLPEVLRAVHDAVAKSQK